MKYPKRQELPEPGPDRERTSPVRIYSPLHQVSEHFVDRLTESLVTRDIPVIRLGSRNGEVGADRRAKAMALGAHIRNARRYVQQGGPNVVAWPLLGWWEMPLWRHDTHKTLIAMHDPEPLVRQNGLTPRAAVQAARLSGSKWPHLVTMSPEATDVAARYFDAARIHLAPHPMRAPTLDLSHSTDGTVLVLGQYKPARDLEIMAKIAPALRAKGWNPVVAGRGWPQIPNWQIIDRLLPEAEFQNLLRSAAVVLLPYRFYFQSGVCLRALESGVPVVGRATGFLTSILGPDFPGAIDDWVDQEAWIEAINAAESARTEQLSSAAEYSARGAVEWAELAGDPSGLDS